MPRIERLLDANANRAREAVRVMEDAARFLLDDAPLARDLKTFRHDFADAMRRVPGVELSRDTPGDVGTAVTTEAERTRRSVHDVATAAGKRLSEALRCLEEFGKLTDPAWAASIEKLRYRGYELERRLVAALGAPHRRQWRLCVIVTESLCEDHAVLDVARAALDGGADCLQLREKSMDAGPLLDRAVALRELTDAAGATLIVNDRPDVASLAGAAGVEHRLERCHLLGPLRGRAAGHHRLLIPRRAAGHRGERLRLALEGHERLVGLGRGVLHACRSVSCRTRMRTHNV